MQHRMCEERDESAKCLQEARQEWRHWMVERESLLRDIGHVESTASDFSGDVADANCVERHPSQHSWSARPDDSYSTQLRATHQRCGSGSSDAGASDQQLRRYAHVSSQANREFDNVESQAARAERELREAL